MNHLMVLPIVIPALVAALSLIGIVWLVLTIRSFPHLPVLVGPGEVLMRVGRLRVHRVPLDLVAGVRTGFAASELEGEGTNLALVEHPNVLLELSEPLPPGRRTVRRIGHKLDDPRGFVAAVEALLEPRQER